MVVVVVVFGGAGVVVGIGVVVSVRDVVDGSGISCGGVVVISLAFNDNCSTIWTLVKIAEKVFHQ